MSLHKKIGFFLLGAINNYNFSIIFSCAYQISVNYRFVNPSLIILAEIIPGFITQLLFPYFLDKLSYPKKIFCLYLSQLLSTLFLLFSIGILSVSLPFIFIGITLVSFNSYFGESVILRLSGFYNKNELKFWSFGTGISGILATGSFLLFNLFLSESIIFFINLSLYFFILSISLYLIDFKSFLILVDMQASKEKILHNNQEISDNTRITDSPQIPLETFESKDTIDEPNNTLSDGYPSINVGGNPSVVQLFIISNSLWIGYYFSYLIGFSLVPLLIQSNFEYQLTQFILQIGKFLGRIIGNYITIKHIRWFGLIHLYTFLLIIILLFTHFNKYYIPSIIIQILFFLSYFINNFCYPLVYQHIYNKYQNKWYMGTIGQFTSFFTILGCSSGYIILLLSSQ